MEEVCINLQQRSELTEHVLDFMVQIVNGLMEIIGFEFELINLTDSGGSIIAVR